MKKADINGFHEALFGGGRRDSGLDGSGRPNVWLTILPGMIHYYVFTFPDLAGIIEIFLTSQQD